MVISHRTCALAEAPDCHTSCLELCRYVSALQSRHDTRLAGTKNLLPILRASACTYDQADTDRLIPQMSPKSLQKKGRVHSGHLKNIPAEEQDQDRPLWYTRTP